MWYINYAQILHILRWQDVIEILFLWICLWALSLFLHKDKQSPLLGYFYGYSFCFISAQLLSLNTITILLLTYAPVCVALCLAFHTYALQKNFVAYKSIVTLPKKTTGIEALPPTVLYAFSEKYSFNLIIERTDQLDTLLQKTTSLHATATESFFKLYLQSQSAQKNSFLWMNSIGTIKGHNALLPTPMSTAQHISYKEQILFFTSTTDALIIECDAVTRTIQVSIDGTLFKNLSIHELHDLLYHYCVKPYTSLQGEHNAVLQKNKPFNHTTTG